MITVYYHTSKVYFSDIGGWTQAKPGSKTREGSGGKSSRKESVGGKC